MCWLLVAADNYLRQQRADRAIILLDFLDLLDPHNLQCQKMLAYAHWLRGDWRRCAAIVESLLRQPLSDEDQAATELMKRHLVGMARNARAANRPARRA